VPPRAPNPSRLGEFHHLSTPPRTGGGGEGGEEKEESDRGSDVSAAAGAGGRPGDPGLGLDEKLEAC
jgi:hypothetical protein